MTRHLALAACLLAAATTVAAADKPAADPPAAVRVKYQIMGLFAPGREADLREAFERLPGFTLVAVDFEAAEATVGYAPAVAFPRAKAEDVVKLFDAKLKAASNNTFGVKPLPALPPDKLQRVEIAVVGHACKGCDFAAYEAVARLDGVERATASFKDGRVVAVIDPATTDRGKLEAALTKKGVQLKPK